MSDNNFHKTILVGRLQDFSTSKTTYLPCKAIYIDLSAWQFSDWKRMRKNTTKTTLV